MRLKSDTTSFLPKRTGSLKRDSPRKVEPIKRSDVLASRNPPRDEVERSGSRSSLRSSRSSLNSATSVNTVRNLGSNHPHLNRLVQNSVLFAFSFSLFKLWIEMLVLGFVF